MQIREIYYKVAIVDRSVFRNHLASRTEQSSGKRFLRMKLIIALVVLCAIACSVEAQRIRRLNASDFQLPDIGRSTGPTYDRPPSNHRFRRAGGYKRPLAQRREEERNNQHNHEVHITDEEIAYYERLFHNRNTEVKAMAGTNVQGSHVDPKVGVRVEHKF